MVYEENIAYSTLMYLNPVLVSTIINVLTDAYFSSDQEFHPSLGRQYFTWVIA